VPKLKPVDVIEEMARGPVIMADTSEPTREEKIADALRAAPAYIADSATVVDWDMTTVLREGSPDWICVPTPPGKPQSAPMCGDPTLIQWLRDVTQGNNTDDRSDRDPESINLNEAPSDGFYCAAASFPGVG
jgi:hypothetical protein